jgi:hypothetical protein
MLFVAQNSICKSAPGFSWLADCNDLLVGCFRPNDWSSGALSVVRRVATGHNREDGRS